MEEKQRNQIILTKMPNLQQTTKRDDQKIMRVVAR